MATISAVQVGPDATGVITVTWETLTATNNVGEAVRLPTHMDKTVTATGTFGGAVTLNGSNDGANFFVLSDQGASDITGTAAYIAVVAENPLWIRPAAAAGVTDVDVILVCAPRNR